MSDEPSPQPEGPGAISKGRVEAFSDGVMAVAITLLALDLHVPPQSAGGSLADRLGSQWPNYVAYAVSFLTIGIIWINHHAMLRRLESVDHTTLMLNIVLLATICILPFSTALMADYLTSHNGQRLSAAIYGGSFLLMALVFFAIQRHALVTRPGLLQRRFGAEARRMLLRRTATGLIPYSAATAGAALSPYVTLIVCGAIAVFYALPATTADSDIRAA